ncbi:MAG: hypothetical protein RL685_7505, partial [Pseudomonadota bacterium]
FLTGRTATPRGATATKTEAVGTTPNEGPGVPNGPPHETYARFIPRAVSNPLIFEPLPLNL